MGPHVQDDDELCLCFHVTKRKVRNYLRVEQPARVGQLSDCYGAGTGCGWCRPFLAKLFEEELQRRSGQTPTAGQLSAAASGAGTHPATEEAEISAETYAQKRAAYILAGKGTPPPGATPVG